MTETTNSPAPASESALSHPLTLDDAASINFDDPEEGTEEVVEGQQSAETPGEAEQGQETEEIEAAEENAEEGEAGSDEPKPEPTDDVHVTVDGKSVPLSEVKLGYMRQADYSRKTQEVASRRKDLEAKVARVDASVNAVAQFLAQQIPPPPPAELAYTNAPEYVAKKAHYEAAVDQLNKLLTQAAEVKEVTSALTQEQRSELIAAENAKLHEAFPQTRTDEGRKVFFETAAGAAKAAGYSDEEIGQAMDHRLFALAHYAAKGMQAEKAQQKAKEKVQNAPPVAPQKARPGERRRLRPGAIRRRSKGWHEPARSMTH